MQRRSSPAGASQISRAVTEHAAGGQGNPRNAAQNFPSPRSGRHRRFENVRTCRRTDLSNKPELCRPLRGLVFLWGARIPGVPSASSASVTARLPCVVPSGLNCPYGDDSTEQPKTNPRRRYRQSENALEQFHGSCSVHSRGTDWRQCSALPSQHLLCRFLPVGLSQARPNPSRQNRRDHRQDCLCHYSLISTSSATKKCRGTAASTGSRALSAARHPRRRPGPRPAARWDRRSGQASRRPRCCRCGDIPRGWSW